jgi:putative ABC transport system ATP-binding protein
LRSTDNREAKGEALIRLDEVRRTYGTGQNACAALKGVTFEIYKGAFTALAGPSGSGKTSLLNIIGGLDTPTSGTVRIEGRDLASMKEGEISELRLRWIGFVFQDFNLVPVLSVAENVEFPLLFRRELGASERKSRVERILQRVGLNGKQRRQPNELSGGERQRVALARALAGEPTIILADEPTANLDQETGAAVIELMRSLNRERGMTFLYTTHDPQLIALADSLLKLRDGRLEESVA